MMGRTNNLYTPEEAWDNIKKITLARKATQHDPTILTPIFSQRNTYTL